MFRNWNDNRDLDYGFLIKLLYLIALVIIFTFIIHNVLDFIFKDEDTTCPNYGEVTVVFDGDQIKCVPWEDAGNYIQY